MPARPTLALMLLIAACASPRERIAARLIAQGVPEAPARCMGAELEERLSVDQLRRLADAVGPVAADAKGRALTLADVARAAANVGDVPTIAAVARASLRCGVLG